MCSEVWAQIPSLGSVVRLARISVRDPTANRSSKEMTPIPRSGARVTFPKNFLLPFDVLLTLFHRPGPSSAPDHGNAPGII